MIENPAAPPAPVMKTEVDYAGFWRRVAAYLIDVTLLFGVNLAIYMGARIFAGDDVQVLTNVAGVCAAIGWAYYVVLESSPARATLGKMALGLYVADLHGDPITFLRAVARNFLKVFSTLVCFVGWLMPAFTPRKQALHDLMAGTLVLRTRNYLVFGREAPTEPGEHWDGKNWVASIPPMEKS
jgi:uncharacterized RDD family membrane protein YckC